MNKLFKVLIFLFALWLVSTLVAVFVFDNDVSSVSGKIVVIPINGMITLNGGGSLLSESVSGQAIVDKINTAIEDDSVKGIVLEINSPGGTVLGSKIVADKVKSVDKPVVAVITEQGTSGAYWIASQADAIVVDDLSIVGSIGVLGSYLDFSGLLNDYNITYQRLVAGDYKDISSPYKEMTIEEEEFVQERLDAIHEYFIKDVASGRKMSYEDVADLSEGLFYLGFEAKDLGLVDYVGDREYAINLTKSLAGLKDGQISEYKDEEGFLQSIFGDYVAYSSFHIGQGIGSVLVSNSNEWKISL